MDTNAKSTPSELHGELYLLYSVNKQILKADQQL